MHSSEGDRPHNSLLRGMAKKMLQLRSERAEMLQTAVTVLSDGDEHARWMAVGVLGEIGDERVIHSLINTLKSDESSLVRSEAASVLGDYRDIPGVMDVLLSALYDRSDIVRDSAFDVLGGIVVFRKGGQRLESRDGLFIVEINERYEPGKSSFSFLFTDEGTSVKAAEKDVVLLGEETFLKKRTDVDGIIVLNNSEMNSITLRPESMLKFIII